MQDRALDELYDILSAAWTVYPQGAPAPAGGVPAGDGDDILAIEDDEPMLAIEDGDAEEGTSLGLLPEEDLEEEDQVHDPEIEPLAAHEEVAARPKPAEGPGGAMGAVAPDGRLAAEGPVATEGLLAAEGPVATEGEGLLAVEGPVATEGALAAKGLVEGDLGAEVCAGKSQMSLEDSQVPFPEPTRTPKRKEHVFQRSDAFPCSPKVLFVEDSGPMTSEADHEATLELIRPGVRGSSRSKWGQQWTAHVRV